MKNQYTIKIGPPLVPSGLLLEIETDTEMLAATWKQALKDVHELNTVTVQIGNEQIVERIIGQ